MTNATSTRNVTVDMPDFVASETVTFTLVSFVAVADNSEIFPGLIYTITLDGSGTGNIDLPTPDGDGTASWAWAVKLPDNNVYDVTLAWAAGAVSLATLLAAAVSTTTPNSLTALLASYLLLAGGTMTGGLTISLGGLAVDGGAAATFSGAVTAEGETTLNDQINANADLVMANATNLILNTSTGTKIGTSTGQKLGLWNATPIVQPTGIVDADGTLADITTKYNALLAKLEAMGLLAVA